MKCPKSPSRQSQVSRSNRRTSPRLLQQTAQAKFPFVRLKPEKARSFLPLNFPNPLPRAVLTLLLFTILPVLTRRTIRCSGSREMD